jgi:hypothetical protein
MFWHGEVEVWHYITKQPAGLEAGEVSNKVRDRGVFVFLFVFLFAACFTIARPRGWGEALA